MPPTRRLVARYISTPRTVSNVIVITLLLALVLHKCLHMDPVTAVSLACNAIQVVEVSYKIVREARELYDGAVSASAKVENLSNVTSDLQDATVRLNSRLKWMTDEKRRDPRDLPDTDPEALDDISKEAVEDDAALRALCEQCAATAEELAETLQGYRVGKRAPGKRGRLQHAAKSLGVAARTYFKDGELDELNERLRDYREQLILRIQIYTREEVNQIRLQQIEEFRRLGQDTKEAISEASKTRRFMQDTTDTQTHVLNNILSARFDRSDGNQDEILRLLRALMPAGYELKSARSPRMSELPGYDDVVEVTQEEEKASRDSDIFEAVKKNRLAEIRNIVRRDPQAAFMFEDDTGMTGLHYACQNGNITIAQHLIRNGARLNADDNDGKVALHYATIANTGPLVRMLVEKEADIDVQDNSDAIPAAYAKEGSEVEWILKWGAKHSSLNDKQETALLSFTKRGDTETVSSLLDQGADPDGRSRYETTALMAASERSLLQIMDLLISRGASIEAGSDRNDTAVCRAALFGQAPAIQKLLDHGANVNAQNDLGYSPLSEAAAHGHSEVARILLSRGANGQHLCSGTGLRPIQHAAQRGHYDIVLACLDAGVPIDSVSHWGWTAMHEASKHGHPAIIELCLSRGGNPNIQTVGDKQLQTALHQAAEFNKLRPLQLLLADSRTNAGLGDVEGFTALHRAAKAGHKRIVAEMVKSGAPVNSKAKNGRHPLLLAAVQGHVEVIDCLIAAGADVNHREQGGSTALIDAACHGRAPAVRTLIRAGAGVDMRTYAGYTALTEACRAGSEDAVRFLLDGYKDPNTGSMVSQADIEQLGRNGWSALMEASHWGRQKCVRLLLDRGARLDWRAPHEHGGQDASALALQAGNFAIVEMLKLEAEKRATG